MAWPVRKARLCRLVPSAELRATLQGVGRGGGVGRGLGVGIGLAVALGVGVGVAVGVTVGVGVAEPHKPDTVIV